MKWNKRGLVFAAKDNFDWMRTHAAVPVAHRLNEEIFRIYFGTRDAKGMSHIGYVDVEAENPGKVVAVSEEPILPLGNRGTFDDCGMMPSWIVTYEKTQYLYYIGWNPQINVPYHLAIGLAISDDGGRTFHRYSNGPVCDRGMDEPYFNTAPSVMREGGTWKMWYVSCSAWTMVQQRPEPVYHITLAESDDGVRWRKIGRKCIDPGEPERAFGRPCVFREDGIYKMLYSHRKVDGYRSDPQASYRLGYAESQDGIAWIRKDSDVGIERSEQDWDSEMMEYCSILGHKGKTYLFYNGNGFGASGFGYAARDK